MESVFVCMLINFKTIQLYLYSACNSCLKVLFIDLTDIQLWTEFNPCWIQSNLKPSSHIHAL